MNEIGKWSKGKTMAWMRLKEASHKNVSSVTLNVVFREAASGHPKHPSLNRALPAHLAMVCRIQYE